jgi:endonuclease YncB( thermonuclease family)
MFLALAAAVVAAGQTFTCTPTRVWDGDGPIWCADGPRIRLSGIAAREMDGTCSRGHPCPNASAKAARDYLVHLLGGGKGTASTGHILVSGPALRCTSTGPAGGNRTGAWCSAPAVGDLSCAMVKSGYAAKWDRYWRDHKC